MSTTSPAQTTRSAPPPLPPPLPRPPALSAIAAEHGLRRVGVRPPLGTYLREVWRRRHFAVGLAASRAYARNQGSYLGQLWAVLTPLLWAGVYLLMFGVVLDTSRGVANYPGFLVVGVFLFHFSSAAIQGGAKAITGSKELIGSLQFPRALLPIASVLAELFTLLPALAVLLVLVPVTGEPVRLTWLLLLPAVALQWVFGTGIAFVCARLVADVRDVARLVPFVLRVLMYTSGVLFSIDHYVDHGPVADVLQHQPIAISLQLGRAALLTDAEVPAGLWLWSAGWAALSLVVGFVWFWRAEARYGRG